MDNCSDLERIFGPGTPANLNELELKVSALVVAGQTNREIAAELELELSTIKPMIRSILRKTHFFEPNRGPGWPNRWPIVQHAG